MPDNLPGFQARGQQALQVFKVAALCFKSRFQGSVISLKLVEQVELLKKLFLFSRFHFWNVPWHVTVTNVRRTARVGSRLSEYPDEIGNIENIARATSGLMALEGGQMAILHPSADGIGGNPNSRPASVMVI